jgi:nitroimidazol reductase NimA-like FMN-containing flavoprotein (pyridoxamine 5'-phosphate oxidase superfamily)
LHNPSTQEELAVRRLRPTEFKPTERSRLRIEKKRGAYDSETIYGILDAAILCHVGYVIDKQPYVTPTTFWREGDWLYWHGSSASRALTVQSRGIPVCLTVTHVDGFVLARSGFNHSINYRSAMVFGTAQLLDDPVAKLRAVNVLVDRVFPGRATSIRPPTDKEIKAVKIVGMQIEDATAKVRTGPPLDDAKDYALPIWAGVVEVRAEIGATIPDNRVAVGVATPEHVTAYKQHATLDDVLRWASNANSVDETH